MANVNLDSFEVAVATKPSPGVSTVEIPEKLASMLAEHASKVVGSVDQELVLNATDEASAKVLAGYAKAWGARQEPKLYIRKLPNGRLYPANVARLAVDLDQEVPAESRPGRKK